MTATRRILAAVASCGLAAAMSTAWDGVAAHADTGWSSWCSSNGFKSVTISSNPTLVLSVGGPFNAETPTVALCYATSANGQPGSGELAGGILAVTVDNSQLPDAPNQVACYSDTDAQIQPLCAVITNPTATWTPATAPAIGGTLTVSVPFVVCAGVNVIVGDTCAGPTGAPPTLAATGLVVSSIALEGGPSCCPDGAVLSPTTTVYIDGTEEATTAAAGAGVNPSAVGAGTLPTATNLLCLPGGQCVPEPAAWIGTSGTPVAEAIVGGTTVPVSPVAQTCTTVGAPSDSCPAPF